MIATRRASGKPRPAFCDLPTSPAPSVRLSRVQSFSDFSTKPLNQVQRQSCPCLAVGTVVQAARRLPQRHPLTDTAGDGVLTALIRSQHLFDEENQGLQRAIDALTAFPRFFLDPLRQALLRDDLPQRNARFLGKSPTKPLDLSCNSTPLDIIHLG